VRMPQAGGAGMSEKAAFIAQGPDGQRLIYFIADPTVEHSADGRITISGGFAGGQRWDGPLPSPAAAVTERESPRG
jgi:hypothetical protein